MPVRGDRHGRRLGLAAACEPILERPEGRAEDRVPPGDLDERAAVAGEGNELVPGGVCHVESTTPRKVWNPGHETLVLLVVGGKGGYVGRDGQLVDSADAEKRRSMSRGDF